MEDLLKADVGGAAITGHDDHVFRLVAEAKAKTARKSAGYTVLVAVVAVHEGDGGLRNRQAATSGGTDGNGVLRIGKRNHGEANKQRHGAASAHRMFFEDFFEAAHLRDGHLLSEGSMFDHVPIFFRHELFKAA